MATHVQDPVERTHPLLWTAGMLAIVAVLVGWFAHFYGRGSAHGRELGRMPAKQTVSAQPDHKALIANKGGDVIDRGSIVYAKNCASCHGAQGNANPSNMNPPPRNFHTDPFKNANGGGPYALYLVLTNGYAGGRMPGFSASISPEDRYAVTHYLREVLVKPNNPTAYVDKDAAKVEALIPAPGAGGGEEQIPPAQRQPPKEVFALMQSLSAQSSTEVADASAWLRQAQAGSQGQVASAIAALDRRLAGSAALVDLRRAVVAGDRKRFDALLLSPAPGAFVPEIPLLSASDLDGLYAQLGKSGARGVP